MDAVPDRFNAIADDPAGRLLRFEAASRAFASRREQRNPVVDCDLTRRDIHQARLVAGDLRRRVRLLRDEIQSLESKRRLAVGDRVELAPPPTEATRGDEPTAAAPAPTTYGRKSYAPPPVGRITRVAEAPPPPAATAPIQNYYHVTNLGTLLDVLA